MVLLDTNVLSEILRRTPNRKVQTRPANHAGNLAASIITLSELRYGAMLHPQPQRFWGKIETHLLPLVQWIEVDRDIAVQAADLNAELRRQGQTSGLNDCIIAATALVHDLVLVTRNTEHFEPMAGLQLENWFQ